VSQTLHQEVRGPVPGQDQDPDRTAAEVPDQHLGRMAAGAAPDLDPHRASAAPGRELDPTGVADLVRPLGRMAAVDQDPRPVNMVAVVPDPRPVSMVAVVPDPRPVSTVAVDQDRHPVITVAAPDRR
jgi:hypothetical protein